MTANPDLEWGSALAALLRGPEDEPETGPIPGAQLVVYNDDDEVFRAPLARHFRVEESGRPGVTAVWVRPLFTPALVHGLPAFVLDGVRRRCLMISAAAVKSPQRLDLELETGQRAVVEPADAQQSTIIDQFDTWLLGLGSAAAAEVAALVSDS